MRVLVTDRRYRQARAALCMTQTEGRKKDLSEQILRMLPAATQDIAEAIGHGMPFTWTLLEFLRKAKWVHIGAWDRAPANGNFRAVYHGGPGKDVARPPALYGGEALRDWRTRARKEGRWDYFLSKRRARYTLRKIRERGRPATPFDALF